MPRPVTRRIGPLLVAPDGRTPLTAVMWRCSKCGEAKPASDFTITDAARGRRRAACKPCEAARLRERDRTAAPRAPRAHDRRTVRVSAPATVTVRVRPEALDGFAACSIAQLVGGA